MAAAYQCDRCGALFPTSHICDYKVSKHDIVLGNIEYDLCDECGEELGKFLRTPPVRTGRDEKD